MLTREVCSRIYACTTASLMKQKGPAYAYIEERKRKEKKTQWDKFTLNVLSCEICCANDGRVKYISATPDVDIVRCNGLEDVYSCVLVFDQERHVAVFDLLSFAIIMFTRHSYIVSSSTYSFLLLSPLHILTPLFRFLSPILSSFFFFFWSSIFVNSKCKPQPLSPPLLLHPPTVL